MSAGAGGECKVNCGECEVENQSVSTLHSVWLDSNGPRGRLEFNDMRQLK